MNATFVHPKLNLSVPPSNSGADGKVENSEVSRNENIFWSCIYWWLTFNSSELEKQVTLFTKINNSKTSQTNLFRMLAIAFSAKTFSIFGFWELSPSEIIKPDRNSFWGPVKDIDAMIISWISLSRNRKLNWKPLGGWSQEIAIL